MCYIYSGNKTCKGDPRKNDEKYVTICLKTELKKKKRLKIIFGVEPKWIFMRLLTKIMKNHESTGQGVF